MIASWWAGLSLVMKILWGVTLTASLIFIIQSILTFIGADADSNFDVDVDTSMDGSDLSNIDGGSNLYTFRNFINFLLGFGWSAILLQESITSVPVLIIVSVIIGVALVAAVMYLFKWLAGMQQSGNIDVEKVAKGCEGTVYLTIPAAQGGEGKVQISISGAVREYNAVTDNEEDLKTGVAIRVVDVVNSHTVLVEPNNSYTV
jgi:membrane protein implicated in regulation of membrane protease activity